MGAVLKEGDMSTLSRLVRRPRRPAAVLCLLASVLPAVALAAEEGDATSKLKPYLPSTVWAILSFVAVLTVILKFVMPKIVGALDERAKAIRESLAAAEKARADAESMMRRHQDDLEKARQEARAIIEEGKADAERIKQKIVSDAGSEAEQISSRAKREIELAKQAALDTLHRQSVELALSLAGRLVEKSLDANDHQSLIQEQIRSFQGRP
jgi:F-type H+-transporting ATPase subunit b